MSKGLMQSNMLETLKLLIKIGLGTEQPCTLPSELDLENLHRLAERQGVSAICFDGLQRLMDEHIIDSESMDWKCDASGDGVQLSVGTGERFG